MRYCSTRNNKEYIESAEAIIRGIAPDGGLYIPESIPKFTDDDIRTIMQADYKKTALVVLSKYLTDFSADELADMIDKAYSSFESPEVVPLKNISGNDYVLELWHGPTSAFKDVALQILPYFMTAAAKKVGMDKKIHILVATSGDTGKAALEGFKDVPNTRITVFYPAEGVSKMQKLQMMTQEGGNVGVSGIKGNFDDAQTGVKRIFADSEMAEKLAAKGEVFSSANSINWGRLVPQIVYYVNAWAQLAKSENKPESFNVLVPTGNFGNILAAYYAKEMGVPIKKLICASNKNNVLTDFFCTGVYNRKREFFATDSPSMDILISSNLERFVYLLSGRDDGSTKKYMKQLSENGEYEITEAMKKEAGDLFFASYATDEQTADTIKSTFENDGYLSDTHTGVGIKVCADYRRATGDGAPVVIASTASPYKFPRAVLGAVDAEMLCDDEFELLERLEKKSGVKIPYRIAGLKDKTIRFDGVCEPENMKDYVLR